MCGIVGIFGPRARDNELLQDMARAVRHRGPDHTGNFTGSGVALAMNRLAIIDIAGGLQPMASSDGQVVLIFNGEIYNFRELRASLERTAEFRTRSDTEVILNGYLCWGVDVFARLNGIYAIALWDVRRGELLLVRDPLGVKPLYYTRRGGDVFFASELKSLIETGLSNRIDPRAVWEFLSAGYAFHPGTALAGVAQLRPGEMLAFSSGGGERVIARLPLPGLATGAPRQRSESPSDLFERLRQATVRQTVADVPLGLLLSSGLDSMALLAALRQSDLVGGLETFTLDFAERDFSEGEIVARLARDWGFRNERFVLTPQWVRANLDQLFHTFDNLELLPTAPLILALSRMAASSVRVLLAGNGGDELFAGYPTYRASELVRQWRWAEPVLRLARPLVRRLHASEAYLGTAERLRRLLLCDWSSVSVAHLQWRHIFLREELSELLVGDWQPPPAAHIFAPQLAHWHEAERAGLSGLDAMIWTDMRSWLTDCGLSMWDKAGMSASVEIRVPLLDLDFLEALTAVPSETRFRPLGAKAFLRRMLENRLPDYVLRLPKHGLQSPVVGWLRGALRSDFEEMTRALPADIVRPAVIARLWRELDRGHGENALKLWCLGSLAGWARTHRLSWA